MSWSKTFTRGDVAQHSSKEDCWVIFDNVVYDVTDFIADHPGGEDLIMEYAGPVSYTHLTMPTSELV